MKKIKYLAPLLALPMLLLSGCRGSASAIGLTANWNKDTTYRDLNGSINEIETLSYAVTFEGKETDGYAVHYEEGTYTTTLACRLIETGRDENDNPVQEYGYYYRTQLEIPVYFTVGEERSETYQDSVTSEVWFLSLDHALQPVKSVKTATSHTPVGNAPKSLDEDYCVFYEDYVCTIEYDVPLTRALINTSYQERYSTQEKATEKKVEDLQTKVSSTNFFDNEQLLFVLRGYDMSAAASLKTLNRTAFKSTSTASVASPKSISAAVDFEMTADGETKQVTESISAYSAELSYSSGMSGQAQQVIYAAKTSANNNLYRNVLLSMEVPLFSSLGSLKYTLKTAVFY